MDALKMELSRKRVTSLQQKKHTVPNTASGPKRKYRRRGEIEAELEAERQHTMQAASALNHSNDSHTSPAAAAAAAVAAAAAQSSEESRPHLHESEHAPSASAVPAALLVEKTNKLLRAMLVPIRFFGESDEQQQKRLRRLQIEKHDRDHSASAGAHNVLQRIEEEIESEILKASHQDRERERNTKGHAASAAGSASSVHKHLEKYRAVKNRDEFEFTEDYVLHFFKRLLLEWEIDLLERLDSVRRSMQGRRETAKQKQTAEYIKPFFKILKNRTVNADILADVGKIVDLAMAREYVKANDWYLRMSIGNAPWPMGVTSVGIHERAARTKIFSNKVAHVLNDENQRKYIQSMKRLLTFAQQKYPNASNTKNVG